MDRACAAERYEQQSKDGRERAEETERERSICQMAQRPPTLPHEPSRDHTSKCKYATAQVSSGTAERSFNKATNQDLSKPEHRLLSTGRAASAQTQTPPPVLQGRSRAVEDVTVEMDREDDFLKRRPWNTKVHVLAAGGADAASSLTASAGASTMTDRTIATMLAAKITSSARPLYKCTAEALTAQKCASAEQQQRATRTVEDNDAAVVERTSFFTPVMLITAPTQTHRGESSHQDDATSFTRLCVSDRSSKGDSEIGNTLTDETSHRERSHGLKSTSSSSNLAAYTCCRKSPVQYGSAERRDGIIKGRSSESSTGKSVEEQNASCGTLMRNDWFDSAQTASSFNSTAGETTLSNNTSDSSGASTIGRGCKAYGSEDNHAAVNTDNSSRSRRTSEGAKSDARLECKGFCPSSCTSKDQKWETLRWLVPAVCRVVALLPECGAAVSKSFNLNTSAPASVGATNNSPGSSEEISTVQQAQEQRHLQHNVKTYEQKEHSLEAGVEGEEGIHIEGRLACHAEEGQHNPKLTNEEAPPTLYVCCISPDLPSTPLGLPKYVLLCIYTMQAFLTGCVYFGWPALSSMLYRSGAYAWLCYPSDVASPSTSPASPVVDANKTSTPGVLEAEPHLYLCDSQDAAVAPLFTVCHVSECIMCVVAGYLTDRCSPKAICVLGQSLQAVGWTLLACSSRGFPAYVPAMIFIGSGSATAYLPLLGVSVLFSHSKATIITILGAANTGSFAVPSILDAIWRHMGVRQNCATAAALAMAAALRATSTVPLGGGSVATGATADFTGGGLLPEASDNGGEGGGKGSWTFTDICLLYLGIGPLCCSLLAVIFLPTRKFSSTNDSRTGCELSRKMTEQKQGIRHRMFSGVAAECPCIFSGAPARADTPTSVQGKHKETGYCNGRSQQAPSWKAWGSFFSGDVRKRHSTRISQQQPRDLNEIQRSPSALDLHGWQGQNGNFFRGQQEEGYSKQRPRVAADEEADQNGQVKQRVKQEAPEKKGPYADINRSIVTERDEELRLQMENINQRSNFRAGVRREERLRIALGTERAAKGASGHGCKRALAATRRLGYSAEEQGDTMTEGYAGEDEQTNHTCETAAQVDSHSKHKRTSLKSNSNVGHGSTGSHTEERIPPEVSSARKQLASDRGSGARLSRTDSSTVADYCLARMRNFDAAEDGKETASRAGSAYNEPCALRLTLPSFFGAGPQSPYSSGQEICTTLSTAERQGRGPEHSGGEKRRLMQKREELPQSGQEGWNLALDRDKARARHRGGGAEDFSSASKYAPFASKNTQIEGEWQLEEGRVQMSERKNTNLWMARWKLLLRYSGVCLSMRRQITRDTKAEATTECNRRSKEEEFYKITTTERCHKTEEYTVEQNAVRHELRRKTADPVLLQGLCSGGPAYTHALLDVSGRAAARGAASQAGVQSDSLQRKRTSTGEPASSHAASAVDSFLRADASDRHVQAWLPLVEKPTDSCKVTSTAVIDKETKATAATAPPQKAAAPVTACPSASRMAATFAALTVTDIPLTDNAACPGVEMSFPDAYSASPEYTGCKTNDAVGTASRTSFANTTQDEATVLSNVVIVNLCPASESAEPVSTCLPEKPAASSVVSHKKTPTFFSQCLSVHFACLVFYSGLVSIAMSFMQSSSSRLFSHKVLKFMDLALPFSFIPCVLMGRMIDLFGPFPVLLFMNTMGLLSYLCAASTRVNAVHYISVLAFCVYVSLDAEQIYCYVQYTFRPEHFGRLSGLLLASDGIVSLVSIPLYDHLTVKNLEGDPLPVAFGISGVLCAAYVLLTALWWHRKKYPDPFGLLDDNLENTVTAYNPERADKERLKKKTQAEVLQARQQ